MDESLMNMFSLIADQVRSRQELFDEEGKIMQALLNSGYHLHEADAALTLMQTLVQREGSFPRTGHDPGSGMRTMTREERERFSADAFGFVIKLAILGIISEDQREELIEKALNAYRGRIDLDLVKALIAFSYREREDAAPFTSRRLKHISWN